MKKTIAVVAATLTIGLAACSGANASAESSFADLLRSNEYINELDYTDADLENIGQTVCHEIDAGTNPAQIVAIKLVSVEAGAANDFAVDAAVDELCGVAA